MWGGGEEREGGGRRGGQRKAREVERMEEEEGETESERKTSTTYKIQCQFCPKVKLYRQWDLFAVVTAQGSQPPA